MHQILVDFSDSSRPMKPMHSVNNGPVDSSVHDLGNLEEYRALEIPYARNHDASFFEGYGGEYAVDVHRIFRDFDADETQESAYDFELTDAYVQTIIAAGTQVFYRLGARIEHTKKVGTFPPKDFAKWARVCEHIIRHYNEGWANGYRFGIQYWEIWNEPDCRNRDGSNPCWQGTDEQFIDLFITTLGHLKHCFPDLKIGGPAFCYSTPANRFAERLLDAVKNAGLPLDFYSFHQYACKPRDFLPNIESGRRLLDERGFTSTETILDEWNYVTGWELGQLEKSFRVRKGLKGAAFAAASMCVAQDSSLDHFMYYDARPCKWNGLFNTDDLSPLKTYYSLRMFSTLYKLGREVRTSSDAPALYCCAASDGESAAVLCVHYEDVDAGEPREVRVNFRGLPAGRTLRAEYFLLDETHNLTCVREECFTASDFSAYLTLDLFSGYLIKLTPIPAESAL